MKYIKKKLTYLIAMLFCMALHVNAQKSIVDFITFPEGIYIEVTNDESNPWTINEEGAIISISDVPFSSAELILTNNSYTDVRCTFEWKVDSPYSDGGISCHDETYSFSNYAYSNDYCKEQIFIRAGSYIVFEKFGEGCGYLKNITLVDAVYNDNEEFEIHQNDAWAYTATISKYVGNESYLTIPATITRNGIEYKITEIGSGAFYGNQKLKHVTIPNTVTTIGEFIFRYCYSLECINIPNSITKIEDGTFYDCHSLNSISIPSSVTSIGYSAFEGCSGLTSLNIPNSVTSIGIFAFSGCSGLTSVYIPNSVTRIGAYAFSGSNLTSVNIPSSVTSIECCVFSHCPELASIKVDINNKKYDSRNNCNSIIDSETNTLIIGCNNSTIPSSITSIGYSAFEGCSGLTSLNIPSSVTSIGDYAFSGCSGLTSVNIPSSVTSIGTSAFFDCSGLKSIVVDGNNKNYDSRNNCNAIIDSKTNTLIVGSNNSIIPSSVTNIEEYAFYNCSGLTSITIPSSVTSIGGDAFYGCKNIKNIIILGNIASLGNYAFYNNQNLSSVTLKGTEVIPVSRDFYEGYGSSKANLANCTLYVPASLLEDCKSATGWKQFGAILPLPEEADYSLYAKDYTVRPGNKARISLMMSNETPITSWQTEMTLPEGFTLAEDDNAVMLSDDRTVGSDISVAYNTLSDGTVKMLASSMTNSYFTDTYGKVATITLDVAPDVKEGEYFVEFKNSKLIDSSTQKYTYDKAIAKITVKNYQTGDLNSDGENDVLDLVNIVNYIMEKPVDGCIESAADINNDGDINGIDYVAEINLILGITPSANTKARVARTASNGNVSSSAVFMEAGTYQNMNIKLNGTNGDYSLMQFDITLPEGVKLAEDGAYILGANSMNHDIAVEHIRKNSYRVMMYSSKKSSIREEQNGVLSLSLVADNDMEVGEYNVNISGKLLVDAEGNYIKPASSAVKLTVSSPTAVETITSADAKADIYSLDGTLIRKAGSTEGLKNGMYISAGKKIIIK